MPSTGLKQQSVDGLSTLPTNRPNKTRLDAKIPVLRIKRKTFKAAKNDEIEKKRKNRSDTVYLKETLSLILTDVYTPARKDEQSRLHIASRSEFIVIQTASNERSIAAATIRQPTPVFS